MGGSTPISPEVLASLTPEARAFLEDIAAQLGSLEAHLRELERAMAEGTPDALAARRMQRRADELQDKDPELAGELRAQADEILAEVFSQTG